MKASKSLEYPGSDLRLLHVKQIYKKDIVRAKGVADVIMIGNERLSSVFLEYLYDNSNTEAQRD
jgi:hypothetical protein